MNQVKNIFLVDDDEIFVYLTKKAIEKSDRVEQLIVYNNGQDVLDFLTENSEDPGKLPEIILLDLSMPILDGWQFLEEYKKISAKIEKKIMIYICTSSISPADILKAKDTGNICDYLLKPITREKIIEIIEKI